MKTDGILWHRLDTPGHDACQLGRTDSGWRLQGAAVFRHEGAAAHLSYRVDCDAQWYTRQGTVRGWVGTCRIELEIVRTGEGVWMLNGAVVPNLEDCIDLDLGFTPATNLFQLRRVALEVGGFAVIPVAWLDVPACTLDVLQQRYERHTEQEYWYEAPRFGYAASLEVRPSGFIQRYPGLWEAAS